MTPDWSVIHFDVNCSRCGTPLNGQVEPRCPNCGIEFAWSLVLPMDLVRCPDCDYQLIGLRQPRCPECGKQFSWSAVLAAARSRGNPLFEHNAVRNPLAALGRTLGLAAFRPSRLWQLYNLHDPARVAPLLALAMVQWLIFARGWPTVGYFADGLMNMLARLIGLPALFIYEITDYSQKMLVFAAWHVGTFLALQVFFWSKRRSRVVWTQTLRVYVHATILASLCPAIWCLLEMLLDTYHLVSGGSARIPLGVYEWLGRAVLIVGVVITWRNLRLGYRQYLRMPRAGALVFLAMLMGLLAAANFAFIMDSSTFELLGQLVGPLR